LQAAGFRAGCGRRAPPKSWDAIKKYWGEGGPPTQRHFAHYSYPQTHDIFPLFSKFFWHLAFLLVILLLIIFLHLFPKLQQKWSYCFPPAVQ
jgi:hypothetical protein